MWVVPVRINAASSSGVDQGELKMIARTAFCAALAGFSIALAGPSGPAYGQQAGCSESALHTAFNLWEGEWNVYGVHGRFGGHNTIRPGANGCVLHEHWQPPQSGMDGHSLNFVDPLTGQWRQVWLSSNVHIDYSGAPYGEDSMHLEGEITYFRPGEGHRSAPFRGRWQRLENGHVIQHFQQFDSDTETWNDWALLTYVPRGQDPNGTDPEPGTAGPDAPAALFDQE